MRSNSIRLWKKLRNSILQRNEHIIYYQAYGIYAWANKNNYWARNIVETTSSRYVTTFTDRLASRNIQSQRNEITLKCHILNILTAVNDDLQDSAA